MISVDIKRLPVRHLARLGLALAALGLCWLTVSSVELSAADPRVEFELVVEKGGSPLHPQIWVQDLSRLGVRNVRIRSGSGGEKLGVTVGGTGSTTSYLVRGGIDRSGSLLLPGGVKFRQGQASAVKGWVDDLVTKGPESERGDDELFGLNIDQFKLAYDDLAQKVGGKTADVPRGDVVRAIIRKLKHPVEINMAMLEVMNGDKVVEDLSGLSCGTALAYTVSRLGLGLYPEKVSGGSVKYEIRKLDPKSRAWPVGWETKKTTRQLLPKSLEQLKTSVSDTSVPTVIAAVSARLETPILLDYRSIRREEIEPDKVMVEIPERQMMYATLLRNALYQARLKPVLRVDESDSPLLWVTTFRQPDDDER